MEEYILTTHALAKKYRHTTALAGVDMHIPKGSIYGFVGKNGAGKTTLIRLICGLQYPTSGYYTLYGRKSLSKDIREVRRRMAAVVETPAIYSDLTAEENLKEQCKVLGLPAYYDIQEILHTVGLEKTGKKKARQFSLGMKQRLGIAVALMGSPDFLVLDEPANGLDPEGIIEVRELILRLNREKQVTVLMSSHILGELSLVATQYGFIDHGRIVREVSADQVREACRTCMLLKVTDTKSLARTLDAMNVEYRIVSGTEAEVYGDVEITPVVTALAANGCEVLSMIDQGQSLEAYYLNVIGGEKSA